MCEHACEFFACYHYTGVIALSHAECVGVCAGDDIGMVLSPQCFHNLNLHEDIFNHSNIHFWEYMQPGYDALGFISCTGQPAPRMWPLTKGHNLYLTHARTLAAACLWSFPHASQIITYHNMLLINQHDMSWQAVQTLSIKTAYSGHAGRCCLTV